MLTSKHVPAPHEVAVLIATSGGRTGLLRDRALPSVYRQAGVHTEAVSVLVVDDNRDAEEIARVEAAVQAAREAAGLPEHAHVTTVVPNARTRGHSGTGAWNTGLHLLAARARPPAWVAILDDDDEFLPDHLARCLTAAEERTVGVFERLDWVRAHGVEPRPFGHDDLSPEAFFVGNPGVQGSNLFVSLDALLAIDGFDEALPSATDRDLMIRLLRYVAATGRAVRALESVGARYFDHEGPRVNRDRASKHVALDRFYAKFGGSFTDAQRARSLERAWKLFGYKG